jgi:hypothetical protein
MEQRLVLLNKENESLPSETDERLLNDMGGPPRSRDEPIFGVHQQRNRAVKMKSDLDVIHEIGQAGIFGKLLAPFIGPKLGSLDKNYANCVPALTSCMARLNIAI